MTVEVKLPADPFAGPSLSKYVPNRESTRRRNCAGSSCLRRQRRRIYLRTDLGAWDMTGVIHDGCGREDMIAASLGDTDDWTVPIVEHAVEDWGDMELVAWIDNPLTVTYDSDRMGLAAKTFFSLRDTETDA